MSMAHLRDTHAKLGTRVAAFGKTTAQGDFLRVRVTTESEAFVQRWIEDGHARRVSRGASIATERVSFSLALPDTSELAIGVMVPSSDSVGRAFPLSVFAVAPREGAPAQELVPIAAQPFTEAVSALLTDAAAFSPSEIESRLDELPPLFAATERANDAAHATTRTETAQALAERCLGERSAAYLAYALDVFAQASEPSRTPSGEERELVLACPLAIDVDLFAWVAIMGATKRKRTASYVWNEETPSLLATFGAPTSALLGFVGRTDARASSLWPITTESEQARTEALARLPLGVARCLEQDGTLADLLEQIAARSGGR